VIPAAWLRRQPLAGYIALWFGISWGGILLILAAAGFNVATSQPRQTGPLFAMMLAGPSASGLIMTAVMDGRTGLHRLGSRLSRRKPSVRRYAMALLPTPLFRLATLWLLSAFVYGAALTPNRILMTWVYRNTGSVLLAVPMHASYTGWLLVLFPATSLTQSLAWQAAFATLPWLAVVFVTRISSANVGAHDFARNIRLGLRVTR